MAAKPPTKKSEKKLENLRPFKPGPDPRRGKGPAKGAPNAGRPPEALRAEFRGCLELLLPRVRQIAESEDSTAQEILAAVRECGKIGLSQQVEHQGLPDLTALLPPLKGAA